MGYLRFSFMLAVIGSHLLHLKVAGHFSVMGFFMLSGFLITLICCEVYPNTVKGKLLFLSNRFMRIYPTYWVCYGVAYIAFMLTDGTAGVYCYGCHIPRNLGEWISDLTAINLNNHNSVPIVILFNTSWALTNELIFYLVIGLVTARYRWLTLIAYLASLAYVAYLFQHNAFDVVYFSVAGTANIFLLGSMCYHFKHLLKRFRLRNTLLLLVAANTVIYWQHQYPYEQIRSLAAIYAHMLPLAYVMISLWYVSQEKKPGRLEQWMSDVSYPAFLIHTLIGAAIVYNMTGGYHYGWDVMIPGALVSLLIATVIVYLVVRPCHRIRRKIRSHAAPNALA